MTGTAGSLLGTDPRQTKKLGVIGLVWCLGQEFPLLGKSSIVTTIVHDSVNEPACPPSHNMNSYANDLATFGREKKEPSG